jgi:UDP-N-acetylmuramate dehydrogenase
VWHLQPLVLVNNGNASADEIIALEKAIINSVEEKFGLTLHPEVEHV